jgi:hypothetical protein
VMLQYNIPILPTGPETCLSTSQRAITRLMRVALCRRLSLICAAACCLPNHCTHNKAQHSTPPRVCTQQYPMPQQQNNNCNTNVTIK